MCLEPCATYCVGDGEREREKHPNHEMNARYIHVVGPIGLCIQTGPFFFHADEMAIFRTRVVHRGVLKKQLDESLCNEPPTAERASEKKQGDTREKKKRLPCILCSSRCPQVCGRLPARPKNKYTQRQSSLHLLYDMYENRRRAKKKKNGRRWGPGPPTSKGKERKKKKDERQSSKEREP